MGKSALVTVALACLLATMLAQGAGAQELGTPVGLTPKGKFSLGVSVSYVLEQKLKDYDLNRNYSDGTKEVGKKFGKFKNDQFYLLSLTYGLTDWLNLFAQAGVVQGGKMGEYDKDSHEEWEGCLKNQFVWGVGAKAQVFKLQNGLTLGVAARYLRYDNRKEEDYTLINSGNYQASDDWSVDDKIDYWQLDLNAVLSRSWGPFTPYLGLGYTQSEAKFAGRWTAKDDPSYYIDYDSTMKNDENFTALCGLEVALGKGISLFAQGVFLARTSVNLGLGWSF